jgi:hypothetical protein
VRFRDAEVGEQERHRLGALWRAAIGVQSEYRRSDLLLFCGLLDPAYGLC